MDANHCGRITDLNQVGFGDFATDAAHDFAGACF
jgi:hypothetical protein